MVLQLPHQLIASTQKNKAPAKTESSFRHLASDGRLRNRPRIDYSTTTWAQAKERKKQDNSDVSAEDFDMKEEKFEKPKPEKKPRRARKETKPAPVKKEDHSEPETTGPAEEEDVAAEERESSPEASPEPEPEPEPETDVKMESETETNGETPETQQSVVLEKLLEDEKLNEIVERKKASPAKISITSRLKNTNQKSFYPFRTHMKHSHHHKKRRVEPVKTPSEPGTPEIVDEEYEEPVEDENELDGENQEMEEEQNEAGTPDYDDEYQDADEEIAENENAVEATVETNSPKYGVDSGNFATAVGTNSPPGCKITNIDVQPVVHNTTLIMNISQGSHLSNKFVRQESQPPPHTYVTPPQPSQKILDASSLKPGVPTEQPAPTTLPPPYQPIPIPMQGFPPPNFLYQGYPTPQQRHLQAQQIQAQQQLHLQKLQMIQNYQMLTNQTKGPSPDPK